MRVGYSILREIHHKNFIPSAADYGLEKIEFRNFIFYLENQGYLERVLKANDGFSLKPARLTKKGINLLEENKFYEETYPEREGLVKWVQVEKACYSNDASID